MWVGDHISFPIAIFDPLLQLAQAAVFSRRLVFGTASTWCRCAIPRRWPSRSRRSTISPKAGSSSGRVGGEFPKEFEACGVPVGERGARLSESIAVMRKLWTGKPVTHDGRFFKFEDITMQPPPRQAGGPPIWCGGRSDAALRRIGRLTDGWMSYVITPDMFRQGLEKIAAAAGAASRPSTAASARPTCCSPASTTPTRRRSMPRPSRSASATAWTSARPPSAIARWAAAAGRRDHAAFPRRRCASRHSRLRRPLRGARPADRTLRRRGDAAVGRLTREMTMRLGMLLRYHGHDLALNEVLEAERLGYDFGVDRRGLRHRRRDADRPGSWPARRRIKVGIGIMQMPARTPACTAMTAMTLQAAVGQPLHPRPRRRRARRWSRAGMACPLASRWRARRNTSRSCARS